jgi:hypothetical protein
MLLFMNSTDFCTRAIPVKTSAIIYRFLVALPLLPPFFDFVPQFLAPTLRHLANAPDA